MMQTYPPLGQGTSMHSRFDIKITLGVVAALAVAITILHSVVFLSIQPTSLSAAMPTAAMSTEVVAAQSE
jgi:hypothetical protein